LAIQTPYPVDGMGAQISRHIYVPADNRERPGGRGMARINTILLAVIAFAVLGYIAHMLYEERMAQIAYIETFADTKYNPNINPPPPDPQLPRIPAER
jgi:hypothetical protein